MTGKTPKQIMASCTHSDKSCLWLNERACTDCGELAKRTEIAERGATPAEAIILACTHHEGRRFCGLLPCCWSCSDQARKLEKAARKAQLDAEKANRLRCCKCGVKPYSYTLNRFPLCGSCKKAAIADHNRAVSKAGNLAFLALGGYFLGDTSDWAFSAFGSLKAWAEEQKRLNPNVTL